MLSVPGEAGVASSALASEKSATSLPKLRSCVVCRSRKVRCDKSSPCSNCRRGNITCVFPSVDRPPRWSRRFEHVNNTAAALIGARATQESSPDVGKLKERLRILESLVKELSSQLEQANGAARSIADGVNFLGSSSNDHNADHGMETLPAADTTGWENQLGRMVLHDANKSRYVSSGFWTRVNDEVY